MNDMMTLGKINATISELRSRIAVKSALVLHIQAMYQKTADGEAEHYFVRDDSARVPESHVDMIVMDIAFEVDELKAELQRWEDTPLEALLVPGGPKAPPGVAEAAEGDVEAVQAPKPETKAEKNATRAPRKDPPPSLNPTGAKAG